MKAAISLCLVGGAAALSSAKLEVIAQQPLLPNACPSNSILHNGECLLASSSTAIPDVHANISQISMSLDESRQAASQSPGFPWTFWPECFTSEDSPEPYCVFSDQTFASGRGIFIVTTKPFAYAMLDKDAFQRPEALARVNHYESPPFEQHDFPGKGRGLVANKTLQRGDQIFASTPILITDPDLYELSEPERLALLYRGVETLPPASQKLFRGLMGHFNGDAVDDRISTNNFEVSIDGVSQSALFPEIAMLNHDCRPNAAYFFDEDSMTHYVHALRTIQPGEEITITYVNNELLREQRMRKLKRNWGFDCACSACTAHPALTAESDSRLQEIATLYKAVDDWTEGSAASPGMVELLVSLCEQERLHAGLATAYKLAAEVYSSFGKRSEAVRYARLSTEVGMLDKGFSDADVKEMRKMSRQPEMTWSWKKRVGSKGGCGCGHKHQAL